MVPLRLIEIFSQVQSFENRQAGLGALAAYAKATEAVLFGKDPEINIFLPAQGQPQTLRHGKEWQAFVNKTVDHPFLVGQLHSQQTGDIHSACGIADKDRLAVIVLLGADFSKEILDHIAALLPLVGAKLVAERAAMSATGHAAAAREANRYASSLNTALDINRRELQKALERAEQELISRHKAEEKLKEADRRKDEFLAMLAHELRNPLAPIRMAAHLLKLPSPGKNQSDKASEIIERQVSHMTSLLDDLLDVSRVTRRLIVLSEEVLDLRSVVSDAIEQARPLIEVREHQLGSDLPHCPIMVKGDPTRLVQIIANLLNNAAKYTQPKGRLSLKLALEDNEAKLSVSDNGIGIDEKLLPYIFDLFTQAERSSDRTQGGLGIGLALVKNLVELHGGEVSASSDGQGKGSEFTVRLPMLKPSELQAESKEKGMKFQAQESQWPVLVVDDNVDAADTLAAFFEALGHKAIVAYHAYKAIELAKSENPTVLILDIGLPDMDGYELAKTLRKLPQTADATLIALTGYGQKEDQERAFNAGFDYHFVKPLDFVRLSALLNKVDTP